MFLRGRETQSTVWQRFRAPEDTFSVRRADGVVELCVRGNAARIVDLFLALLGELPPALSVSIDDVRSSTRWSGEGLALPDVNEALARLKVPLTTFAGADVCVWSPEEQVTLTAWLDLYVHAVHARWVYLLLGHGLREAAATPRRSWRVARDQFPPSSEASLALRAAAERLLLVSA
jgi:hypothetical protein